MKRIASVSHAILRVGILCVLLGACAQGFEGPQAFGFDTPGADHGGGQIGGGAGQAGDDGPAAGSSAAGMGAAGMGAFDGEPCLRGETEACECDNGGTGSRTCAFDAESPTEGSFSECGRCSGGAAGSGGSGSSGAGGSGASGSGASGSGGRGGSGSSGASGSGSSGSGSSGSGGSAAPPPPPSSGSEPGWCLFVPVPLPGVCK